jgi:hypothetical protein
MKIILSRKGFDSKYGKQPSPILPDGTLLSFPIPSDNDLKRFSDIPFGKGTYLDIIKELNPKSKYTSSQMCHLDPDLRHSSIPNRIKHWKPVFGQSDAAQSHLQNQQVTTGDVFLFFGTFRYTQYVNDRLMYIPSSPDLHVIYGYFQIGEMYKNGSVLPPHVQYHPHANSHHQSKKTNCIYVASDRLSFDDTKKGSDVLSFNSKRILTKPGETKGKWQLPNFFRDLSISYHENAFTENYFQSVDIGQEFVIHANDSLLKWTQEIICS